MNDQPAILTLQKLTREAKKTVSITTAKAISAGELLNKTFPDDNAVIGSALLHQGSILVIGGPPKTYKSFLVSSMAFHLVTGTNMFGATRSPRPGTKEPVFPIKTSQRVLILEQEIGERDLQERLASMMKSLSQAEAILVKEKLFFHSCDHNMSLDSESGRRYIAKLIEQVNPGVVCFDPLVEFHNSDENSASEMAKVLHGIDWLRERYPFSTILVHHLSKPNKESGRKGPDLLRGSSVIFGKGDSFMVLKNLGDDPGTLQVNFTVRRGKPIDAMVVKVDFDTLQTQFQYWNKARKDRRSDLDSE